LKEIARKKRRERVGMEGKREEAFQKKEVGCNGEEESANRLDRRETESTIRAKGKTVFTERRAIV